MRPQILIDETSSFPKLSTSVPINESSSLKTTSLSADVIRNLSIMIKKNPKYLPEPPARATQVHAYEPSLVSPPLNRQYRPISQVILISHLRGLNFWNENFEIVSHNSVCTL